MSSPIHASAKSGDESPSAMDVSVITAIGELLAAAARLLDGDVFRRLCGPGLYRRLASALAAFLTFAIVMRVGQCAGVTGRRFVHVSCEAQRHLSHPPAGWAAP